MLRHFQAKKSKLLLVVFACLFSGLLQGAKDEAVADKRIRVAMRMIGHEVLMCLGDQQSRVMPIEQVGDHYKISFEFEFGFDPGDIVSLVDDIMTETGTAIHYLVEVEQCETGEIVHSFEMNRYTDRNAIACTGRILPPDCYNLLITILDGVVDSSHAATMAADRSPSKGLAPADSSVAPMPPPKSDRWNLALIIIPLLILAGVLAYLNRKKSPAQTKQDLIRIGAYQFDPKKMSLSFHNTSIELSNKEVELLALLYSSANAPLSREVILHRVWGDEGDYVGRTLDVFISRLRKKLESDDNVKIVNIRGVGYKLVMDEFGEGR